MAVEFGNGDGKVKKVGNLVIGTSKYVSTEDYIQALEGVIETLKQFPKQTHLYSITIQNDVQSKSGIRIDMQAGGRL